MGTVFYCNGVSMNGMKNLKMVAFLESSLMTKHRSILMSQRVNSRAWNGNIYNRPARKSSKANHLQENIPTVLCDSQGPILEPSEMLTDRLKCAI
jgi:hypothetical protein